MTQKSPLQTQMRSPEALQKNQDPQSLGSDMNVQNYISPKLLSTRLLTISTNWMLKMSAAFLKFGRNHDIFSKILSAPKFGPHAPSPLAKKESRSIPDQLPGFTTKARKPHIPDS